jgi:hypothetical protein
MKKKTCERGDKYNFFVPLFWLTKKEKSGTYVGDLQDPTSRISELGSDIQIQVAHWKEMIIIAAFWV